MQYALFYIDFFVNNIQKNHHLTALNGDFIIVCVTFLIMCFNGLLPFLHFPLGTPWNVELANSVLQHDDLCKLYKNSLSTIHFYIILKQASYREEKKDGLSTIHFYIILKHIAVKVFTGLVWVPYIFTSFSNIVKSSKIK